MLVLLLFVCVVFSLDFVVAALLTCYCCCVVSLSEYLNFYYFIFLFLGFVFFTFKDGW